MMRAAAALLRGAASTRELRFRESRHYVGSRVGGSQTGIGVGSEKASGYRRKSFFCYWNWMRVCLFQSWRNSHVCHVRVPRPRSPLNTHVRVPRPVDP
eukprot:861568-Prymnesium_polylepis.1